MQQVHITEIVCKTQFQVTRSLIFPLTSQLVYAAV